MVARLVKMIGWREESSIFEQEGGMFCRSFSVDIDDGIGNVLEHFSLPKEQVFSIEDRDERSAGDAFTKYLER